MMRTIPLLLSLLITISSAAGSDLTLFDRIDAFLSKTVVDGAVAYAAIAAEPQPLQNLVQEIATFDLHTLPEGSARKAFWLNAYNILVIDGIIRHYPVPSPMEVAGFFKRIKRSVAGEELSLDEIEHKRIRKLYPDARVHFGLVCAARGCPPLAPEAFRPDELDRQLEERTRDALRSSYFVRIDEEERSVAVSQIFEWFEEDFKRDHGSIRNYVNHYREDGLPDEYRLTFYTYDWTLNDTASRGDSK